MWPIDRSYENVLLLQLPCMVAKKEMGLSLLFTHDKWWNVAHFFLSRRQGPILSKRGFVIIAIAGPNKKSMAYEDASGWRDLYCEQSVYRCPHHHRTAENGNNTYFNPSRTHTKNYETTWLPRMNWRNQHLRYENNFLFLSPKGGLLFQKRVIFARNGGFPLYLIYTIWSPFRLFNRSSDPYRRMSVRNSFITIIIFEIKNPPPAFSCNLLHSSVISATR